jgi:hypothetical protein
MLLRYMQNVGNSNILLGTFEMDLAVDLDWFFRGWFYSTDFVDIGINDVKQYVFSETPTKELKDVKGKKVVL